MIPRSSGRPKAWSAARRSSDEQVHPAALAFRRGGDASRDERVNGVPRPPLSSADARCRRQAHALRSPRSRNRALAWPYERPAVGLAIRRRRPYERRKAGAGEARPGYRIYFVREGNGALPENWLLLRHEPIVWSVGLLRLIARDILLMQRSQLILGGLGSYSFRPIAPTSIQSRWLLQS